MIKKFPNEERGEFQLNWLHAKFSFSFNTYQNPSRLHYKNLRVLNEDKIQPGGGFDMHSHSDMEIVTYVISGQVAHKDNLGNQYTVSSGQVQRMTAGSGITHSEFNPSQNDVLHLLQIWVFPDSKGLPPSYETKDIISHDSQPLVKIASPQPSPTEVKIHQSCEMYISKLKDQRTLRFSSELSGHTYLQIIEGSLDLNGQTLSPGDVVYVEEEDLDLLSLSDDTHFILIDQ